MDPVLVSARHAIARELHPILCVATCCAVLAVPREGSAQIVTPKTLPVLQDGQFDIFPSARAGMAGTSIAVDDSLLDPFVNPAKAARIESSHVFSAPFFHNVSHSRGGGKTLPVGGDGSWENWAVTGLVTFQQLDRSSAQLNLSTSDKSALNQYAAGSIARRLTTSTSLGLGVQIASLNAIDGVDFLYPGSDRIEQSGGLADYRFGLSKELGADRHFELMLLHSRSHMEHDVRFTTWRWDPMNRRNVEEQRTENNQDQTRIWGLHSEYSRPVGSDGWHIGWLGTMNRLAHPKIPNYVIQNIPRDPGTTWSFNAGTGVSRTVGGTSFAADLIYEPMFSDTWATAATDTSIVGGGTIAAGAKTVENNFRFNNVKARLGAGDDLAFRAGAVTLGYQFGVGVYSIRYRLQQADHVRRTFRTQHEDWMEWSPTFGLRLRSGDLDVLYNFSLTCGAGACGTGGDQPVFVTHPGIEDAATGIIVAPSGQLFMQGGVLKTHKLTIRVPIH